MDNMLETAAGSGMDIVRAMRLLVPPAWQNNPDMDPELRAFFDFNSMHMEPWGRPAASSCPMGATLPVTSTVTSASGTLRHHQRQAIHLRLRSRHLDYQPDEVVEKGRVGPGELMLSIPAVAAFCTQQRPTTT
ncbi:Glutamate synthase [NADPH] large chain precursor [Raoultella terrigena]|uniref:Glutamate synthase [NADPH] large chain n=1 Tax=Raoultella terrigena TaxID=577 RepID=A0A4U9D2U6_RAOTE|nr:Glutamate synthase [NADPH] large chain precursor [Raoultella terrigena]